MKARTERKHFAEPGYFRVLDGIGQVRGVFKKSDNAEHFAKRIDGGGFADACCVFICDADLRKALARDLNIATDFSVAALFREAK